MGKIVFKQWAEKKLVGLLKSWHNGLLFHDKKATERRNALKEVFQPEQMAHYVWITFISFSAYNEVNLYPYITLKGLISI